MTNAGPSTSVEGNNITYTLKVTNNGPTPATGVVLTDTLDANLKYISSTKSQGSVSRNGSVVKFSFGTVAVGQSVTATITAQATEDGDLINTATVTSNVSDANLLNNTALATVAVAEPPIVVSAPITVTGKNQNNIKVATFTHASGVEPTSDFVATINWGDGATSTGTITLSGATYSVKGSHTYSSNGTRTVTTTVVETEVSSALMHALALTGTSTPTTSTGNRRQQSNRSRLRPVSPPSLKPAAVDLVLGDSPLGRRGSAVHAGTANLDESALDELFAAG